MSYENHKKKISLKAIRGVFKGVDMGVRTPPPHRPYFMVFHLIFNLLWLFE
jgi:hypothetical protein